VIRIIRSSLGDGEDRAKAMAAIMAAGGDRQSKIGIARLSALLALAKVNVLAPGTAWLSHDELRVLAWLAYAQRVTMPPDYPMLAPAIGKDVAAELRAELVVCGRELEKIGCRLPPLAFTHDIARPVQPCARRRSRRTARSV
jgi:hypothetical protein